MSENPLLQPFETPFDTFPFSKVQDDHFLPAIQQAITEAKEQIAHIKQNAEVPTFANTIEALERAGKRLDVISTAFFNLNHADTNDTRQTLAQEISPLLTEYGNDILLDHDLFQRVKAVFEGQASFNLTTEQARLLEKSYKSFVRNGANLSPTQKETLREIDKELAQASLKFGENVLADTKSFTLVLEQETELEGLPESVIESAAMTAKSMGQEGKWVFSLAYPSYQPFMTYSTRRDLRQKMFLAFGSKGFRGNEFDNRELIKKIASLRHQRAHLLGYASHADFVLEERMANSPKIVHDFLNEMLQYAQPASIRDVQELAEYARQKDGIEQLERWDILHYSERLKKERFDIDDELLRPYFKLENVTKGIFEIATRLFDLQFVERKDIDTYHEEVETYEVLDKAGKHLAILYMDFFPRHGYKKDGAWMTSFRGQWVNEKGENVRPHVSLVCNFTKPTESKPSLLTHNEVLTFFHEFGHGLHLILSQCHYDSLAGTNVSWDFVELPSQLMENWGYAQESLNTFARHYEIGEPIPAEYLAKIRETRIFQEGYFTLRQLSFGLLDMAWHTQNPDTIEDVVKFEHEAIAPTQVGLPAVEGTLTSTAFSHIFQGGYSAGYYSYKWAEVLEADAFELFEEKGVFDKNTAESLRQHILSKGSSEQPMELYKRFRGHTPSPKALLKKAGLI